VWWSGGIKGFENGRSSGFEENCYIYLNRVRSELIRSCWTNTTCWEIGPDMARQLFSAGPGTTRSMSCLAGPNSCALGGSTATGHGPIGQL